MEIGSEDKWLAGAVWDWLQRSTRNWGTRNVVFLGWRLHGVYVCQIHQNKYLKFVPERERERKPSFWETYQLHGEIQNLCFASVSINWDKLEALTTVLSLPWHNLDGTPSLGFPRGGSSHQPSLLFSGTQEENKRHSGDPQQTDTFKKSLKFIARSPFCSGLY